jgi:hypothetical protein
MSTCLLPELRLERAVGVNCVLLPQLLLLLVKAVALL